MQNLCSKIRCLGYGFVFLLLVGFSFYVSKDQQWIRPQYQFLLFTAVLPLIASTLLTALGGLSPQKIHTPLLVMFQLVQALLGFALCHYFFGLKLQQSAVFPLAALLSLLSWFVLKMGVTEKLAGLFLIPLIASGFAVSLRLGQIAGGLLFAITFMNADWLGRSGLSSQKEVGASSKNLWSRLLIATGLAALGRAAIHFYLMHGSIAEIGVVISQPYTFVCLFIGIFTPFAVVTARKEKIVHPVLLVLIAGVVIPLAMLLFFHIRPAAAYLLGFISAAWVAGVIEEESGLFVLVSPLAFVVMGSVLSYFKKQPSLNVMVRLEIALGLAGFLFVLAFLNQWLISRKSVDSVQ